MKKLALFLALLFFFPAPRGEAQLDAVQERLLRNYAQPLRWDNIEGCGEILEGKGTYYDLFEDMHLISLKKDEFTLIKARKGRQIRLHNPIGKFLEKDIELFVSNGTGLFRAPVPQISEDGTSLFYETETNAPFTIKIKRGGKQEEAIEFAVFLSRRDTLREIAPYREIIEPRHNEAEEVKVRHNNQKGSESYWHFQKSIPVSFEVDESHPVRIAFEHRLFYEPKEVARIHPYRVYVQLDGKDYRIFEYSVRLETAHEVLIDCCDRAVGTLERGFIEIPRGKHTLTIARSSPLYGRVLMQEVTDYLFPGANEPAVSAAESRKRPFSPLTGVSSLAIGEKEIKDVLTSPEATSTETEAVSNAQYQLGKRRETGMVGFAAMDQVAKERPDFPDAQKAADRFFGLKTFYRNLLPSADDKGLSAEFNWFIARKLIDTAERDKFVAGKSEERFSLDFLNTLSGAYFTPLPRENGLTYYLPESFAPSILRIAALKGGSGEIGLKVDGGNTTKILLRPRNGAEGEFRSHPAEVGLQFVQQHSFPYLKNDEYPLSEYGHMTENPTLEGLFASRKTPANLREAAYAEVAIPQGAKKVLITDHGDASSLKIALQYRASKTREFSESEFLDAVEGVVHPYSFFLQQLHKSHPMQAASEIVPEGFPTTFTNAGEVSPQELSILWQPLFWLLKGRMKVFTASVASDTKPATHFHTDQQRGKNQKRALAARNAGNFQASLASFSEIAMHSRGKNRYEAQREMAEDLMELGEYFIAINTLKGIFLYATDREKRRLAFERLETFYQNREDEGNLLRLYSTAAFYLGTPEIFGKLATSLVENGFPLYALSLGIVLEKENRPIEPMARAALNLNWNVMLEGLLNEIPDPKTVALFQGQVHQKQGNYGKALNLFHRAGEKGAQWIQSLVEGRKIRREILSVSQKDRLRGAERWMQWMESQPGKRVWASASHLVAKHEGTRMLYNPSLAAYSQAWKGRGKKPVRLQAIGPALLRFEVRPIHGSEWRKPLNDWLTIRDNEKESLYSISNNLPSDAFVVVGHNAEKTGKVFTVEYPISAGLHTLDIETLGSDFTLQPSIRQPETPLSVLPPLTPATLSLAGIDLHDIAAKPEKKSQQKVGESFLEFLNRPLSKKEKTDTGFLIERMTKIVWIAEHAPELYPLALLRGESLALESRHIPEIQALKPRLTKKSGIEPFHNIEHSAGERSFPLTSWQPETDFLQTRKTLLAHPFAGERFLYGYSPLSTAFSFLEEKVMEVHVTREDVGYLPESPVWLQYQLDDGKVRSRYMPVGKSRQYLSLRVPSGEHSLKIWNHEPTSNGFLRMRFFSLDKGGKKTPLLQETQRKFHIATRSEPITLQLQGPAMFFTREKVGDKIKMSHQVVEEGWQKLSFKPQGRATERLLRFFVRKIDPEKQVLPVRDVRVSYESVPDPLPFASLIKERRITPPNELREEPEEEITWIIQPEAEQKSSRVAKVREVKTPESLQQARHRGEYSFPEVPVTKRQDGKLTGIAFVDDQFTLGGQEDGTWTLRESANKRSNIEEDAAGNKTPEHFLETNLTHRYFAEEGRKHFKTQFLLRGREYGGPTFGIKEDIIYRSHSYEATYRLGADFFLQRPDALGRGSYEWLANLKGSVSQSRIISPKSYHVPRFYGFFRVMSLNSTNPYTNLEVDQDIFTAYKASHKWGIGIGDTLFHRPWLDTIWFASAGMKLNENFSVDNFPLQVGWQQLVCGLELDAVYRFKYYLKDNDRRSSVARNSIKLDLSFDNWFEDQSRLEAGLQYIHELETGRNSGFLYLQWQFGYNGRGYRDFTYEDSRFYNLRQRRVPHLKNNGIGVEER